MSSELVQIFRHVAKVVRSGSIRIPYPTRIALSFQVAWKLFIDGLTLCIVCLYAYEVNVSLCACKPADSQTEMARYSSSTILLSSDYIGQWVHFRKWSGNCASQRDRDGARSRARRRLREKCNFGHHQGGSRKLKGSIVRDLYAIQRFWWFFSSFFLFLLFFLKI